MRKRSKQKQDPKPSKKNKRIDDGMVIRPRRILMDKKMILLRPQDFKSVQILKKRLSSSGFDSRYTNGTSSLTNEEVENLFEQCEKEVSEVRQPLISNSITVPVPSFHKETSSDAIPSKRFELPKHYIVYDESKRRYEIANEYDMNEQDEQWLSEFNKNRREPLSDLDFERIIALLNIGAIQKGGYMSVTGLKELCKQYDVEIRPEDFLEVRRYWEERNRSRIQKLQAKENKLVEMQTELEKLQLLRQDFERLRILLELCRKREKLKKRWATAKFEEMKAESKLHKKENGKRSEISENPSQKKNQSQNLKRKRTNSKSRPPGRPPKKKLRVRYSKR